ERNFVFMPLLAVYTAAVLVAVPYAILPLLRSHTPIAVPTVVAPIDTSFIRASIQQIQTSMAGSVRDIQREQARIEAATAQLVEQVDKQNARIRTLQHEREILAQQIVSERALASLTKDQAEAVRQSLTRGRYLDYMVGFFIGVVSSVTASLSLRFLS